MSIPSFSAFPEIPQRSTPEADFDAKMYALFQHFATTHRQELLAFIQFLENNVTAIEGAINGVTIGLTHPAAAKFTSLAADSISGAAVQASVMDTDPGKLTTVGAFGWGGGAPEASDASITDMNDLTTAGVWTISGTVANKPDGTTGNAGVCLVLKRKFSAGPSVTQLLSYGSDVPALWVRVATGAPEVWSDWHEVVALDESGRTPQNIEIRNSGPFIAITDVDTGVKHNLSGNSTAGHLYVKVDPASNALDPKLLLELQGARPLEIGKDDIKFNVPIGSYLGIGQAATSPVNALHIRGSSANDSRMRLQRDDIIGSVGIVSYDLLLEGRGSTGTDGGVSFYTGGTQAARITPDGTFRPGSDGVQNCGFPSYRWDVFYGATGSINTSDARSKQDIQDLDEAERRVALAAKRLLKKYRLRDAVAKKGDAARWHFGVIAQELAAAFEDEGLDPWRYGVLCWDEWWSAEVEIPAETAPIMREVVERIVQTYPVLNDAGEPTGETREKVEEVRKKVDTGEVKIVEPARTELKTFASAEEAPEGAEYHDRQGVRYDELFAFILAAL